MAPTKKEVAQNFFENTGMGELYTCKLCKKQKKQAHKSGIKIFTFMLQLFIRV